MTQTAEGALKAKKTIYKKYGKDHYRKIGAIGGAKSGNPWLKNNSNAAAKIGAVGGKRGKIGYKLLAVTDIELIYLRKVDNVIVKYPRNDL